MLLSLLLARSGHEEHCEPEEPCEVEEDPYEPEDDERKLDGDVDFAAAGDEGCGVWGDSVDQICPEHGHVYPIALHAYFYYVGRSQQVEPLRHAFPLLLLEEITSGSHRIYLDVRELDEDDRSYRKRVVQAQRVEWVAVG